MAKNKIPVTSAVRALRKAKVEFTPHTYRYEPRGGTTVSSRELGVDEHTVVKTLIMEADGQPLVILMHGDLKVSTRKLARHIGARTLQPCPPDKAQRHSGYMVGGTSPFGLRKDLPIYAQSTIEHLPSFYINGGKRGFLVQITPQDLTTALDVEWVDVARGPGD